MKRTQYEKIIAYMRKHGACTTWELSQAARSLSVHRRLAEMCVLGRGWGNGDCVRVGAREWVRRAPVKRGSRWVTEYRLVRV